MIATLIIIIALIIIPIIVIHVNVLTANCGDPLDNVLDQSSIVVVGYNDTIPSLEGNTVNYTCYPGVKLTGPNMSTCMENGNWEPDPRNVNCIGEFMIAYML